MRTLAVLRHSGRSNLSTAPPTGPLLSIPPSTKNGGNESSVATLRYPVLAVSHASRMVHRVAHHCERWWRAETVFMFVKVVGPVGGVRIMDIEHRAGSFRRPHSTQTHAVWNLNRHTFRAVPCTALRSKARKRSGVKHGLKSAPGKVLVFLAAYFNSSLSRFKPQ